MLKVFAIAWQNIVIVIIFIPNVVNLGIMQKVFDLPSLFFLALLLSAFFVPPSPSVFSSFYDKLWIKGLISSYLYYYYGSTSSFDVEKGDFFVILEHFAPL